MDPAPSELLTGVIVETFEKMAFFFALPAAAGAVPPAAEESLETVELRFSGPFSGRLQLGLSGSLMAELAGNMLGAEEGAALSAEEQRDALGELLNVVCGNLLPLLGGPDAEFAIGSPQQVDRAACVPGPESVVTRLSVEGGFCRAALEWDGPPPANRAGGADASAIGGAS
ncbi:MAG: chemotaxis protein CheX [Desulfobacterales bacterium]|jgi:hypothetical protein|nr:chemotaxis protein CheX [Desulfobacterales bacterium]